MPNYLARFWQELKRRKVIKSVAMYAATAFIILEAADIILPRLGMPDWTVTFLIILLIVGFPIMIILSWIFDITPEGIKKTGAVEAEETPVDPGRRNLRFSDVIIAVLLIVVAILIYPKVFNRGSFDTAKDPDGRISIAVMPFKNLTGDTLYNIWQEGLQNLLITSLSNSEELSVRQFETMLGIYGSNRGVNYASLTPAIASDIARKLEASTMITGNMHKYGSRVRITVNLMNAGNEEIFKSYEIDGTNEDDFFSITDSVSSLIKSYLEIKSLNQRMFFDLKNAFTQSTEAYKMYIQGYSFHGKLDYSKAIDFYMNAIRIDSNFVSAMTKLAYCYGDIGKTELSKTWAYEAFRRIDQVPLDVQLTIREVKAAVDKKPEEQIKNLKQYIEINPYCSNKWYGLGWVSFNTGQWQPAIEAFERNLELMKKFDGKSWVWTYILLGRAYHETGDHKKEFITFRDGLDLWPDEKPQFDYWRAICAVAGNDTAQANHYLEEIRKMGALKGWPEAIILSWFASIYDMADSIEKAEEYYREALNLYPDNAPLMNDVANFLILHDLDVDESTRLITRALEEEPENAGYLYTYGLALFKEGKLEESLAILKRSWDKQPYYDHEHYLQIRRVEELLAGM
ncbi:MAG: tetratricopeptide repeat protein [Bacteroidota bacterium]